jgi:heme exporter protein A
VKSLEARGLACSRGPVTLFRDVSFAVVSGEWIALRGANGSGKTTLLRCIAGLTQADAGDVLWEGAPVSSNAAAFHHSLSYGGHLAGIKDDLTADENLAALVALRGTPANAEARRDALARVGLDKRRHLQARRLSAGQRRRIGLARLALERAPLWALDEPLTALDDEGQRLFEGMLADHIAAGGVAVIATHHPLAPQPARELRLGA